MRIRRISNSEVQTWKRCRRKWWLTWHRGLAPANPSPLGALAIGTRIHAALAAFYVPDGRPFSDPRDELLRLLAEDRAALADAYNGFIPVDVKKEFESEADLQRIMLDGYMDWLEESGTDEAYEVIASEDFIEAKFMELAHRDLQVNIIGRLDVRVRRVRDGKIMFIDHKTAASITALLKTLSMNEQMKMYRLLIELTVGEGEKPSGAVYSILKKVKRSRAAKPPFYHREFRDFNPTTLRNFRLALKGVITDILHAEKLFDLDADHHVAAYPTPTKDCDWDCAFAKICPMFDDGSRVEDAIAEHYRVINPLTYYDQENLERHDTT